MGDLTGRWGLMVCASGGCERGGEACNSFNSPDFWSERRAAGRIRLLLDLWLPADSLPARIRGCDASRRPMARELFDKDRTYEAWVCLRSQSQERDEGQGLKGER